MAWRRHRFYTSVRGCPRTEDEKGSRCESDTGPLLYSARLLQEIHCVITREGAKVVRAVSQKTCLRDMPISASASGRRLRDRFRAQGTIDISVQTQTRPPSGSIAMSSTKPSSDETQNPIAEVSSPCNGICTVSSHLDVCIGCYRTRGEIANWSRASNLERHAIVSACEARRKQNAST